MASSPSSCPWRASRSLAQGSIARSIGRKPCQAAAVEERRRVAEPGRQDSGGRAARSDLGLPAHALRGFARRGRARPFRGRREPLSADCESTMGQSCLVPIVVHGTTSTRVGTRPAAKISSRSWCTAPIARCLGQLKRAPGKQCCALDRMSWQWHRKCLAIARPKSRSWEFVGITCSVKGPRVAPVASERGSLR